jgi:hypothetical protein
MEAIYLKVSLWLIPKNPFLFANDKDIGGTKALLNAKKNLGSIPLGYTAETAVMRYTHLSFNPRRDTAMPCPYRVS